MLKKMNIQLQMMITTTSHELLPATEALQRAMRKLPVREVGVSRLGRCSHSVITTRLDHLRVNPAFDMRDLIQATRPVQDSIAFPVIEWGTDDDEEGADNDSFDITRCRAEPLSDDEDSELSNSSSSLGKRCRDEDSQPRLVRSKASSCLSSMDSVPDRLDSSFPRSSTWGQFLTEDDESCNITTMGGRPLQPKQRLCRKSVSAPHICDELLKTLRPTTKTFVQT
jgi:hypothetical protein